MIQEVTKRRASAKTTSMLTINSIHSLEEEFSKGCKSEKPPRKANIFRISRIKHTDEPADDKRTCSTYSNNISRDPIRNIAGNEGPHFVKLMGDDRFIFHLILSRISNKFIQRFFRKITHCVSTLFLYYY